MSNKLLFASLIAVSSYAAADPAPAPAPAPEQAPHAIRAPISRCAVEGPILIEKATKTHGKVDMTLPTLTVYDTGAWTYTETRAGKVTLNESGCLTDTQLVTVQRDIKTAPWKTSDVQFRCEAMALTYVEWASHGKVLFDQEMCGPTTLDGKSAKTLRAIDKILTDARKAVAKS